MTGPTHRYCGAVLDVTDGQARIWVNGLTDDTGVTIATTALPAWMPYQGRTFDLTFPTELQDDPLASIAAGTFARQRCDDDGDGPVDEEASWGRLMLHAAHLAARHHDGVL